MFLAGHFFAVLMVLKSVILQSLNEVLTRLLIITRVHYVGLVCMSYFSPFSVFDSIYNLDSF